MKVCGVIVSTGGMPRSLGLTLSVNFSAKISLISLCASAGIWADWMKVTTPWPLTMVCVPAWFTVAIGCSVSLSSRTYSPVTPLGSTRTWNDTGGATPGCGISKAISTRTAVPRMPMVAVGVSTFMSPCFAVAPATNEMVPCTRVSNEELLAPFGS